MNDPFSVGDVVEIVSDGSLATVVYLPPDGMIAVETPWSAEWRRYQPRELRLVTS